MHLNELEQLNGAHNKQVTELENQISPLQVCTVLFTIDIEGLKFPLGLFHSEWTRAGF